MGAEFDQAWERDKGAVEKARERFNQGAQGLANRLEELRKEADGENGIDTEKLNALSAQMESMITQLDGGLEASIGQQQTETKREPSPFDSDYEGSVTPKPMVDESAPTVQTNQEIPLNQSPFA